MTPMMVIGIVLCMPALGPLAGTKLATPLAIVPVTGPCLALVTLMTHSGSLLELPWAGLAAAFISTYAWATLSIRWATRLFNREAVLFRESEAFDLRLWIKHVLGRPRTVPRPGDAAVVFMASLLLLMLVGTGMQASIVDGVARIKPMGLVLSQILLIAGPALLMAGILRVRSGLKITNALSLRAGPVPWLLPIVPLIAVAAWVINQLVVKGIIGIVPGWGETAAKFSQQISGLEGLGLPAMLAIFAVTPAVCEDLLVRGFILAGMTANAPAGRTPWKAASLGSPFRSPGLRKAAAKRSSPRVSSRTCPGGASVRSPGRKRISQLPAASTPATVPSAPWRTGTRVRGAMRRPRQVRTSPSTRAGPVRARTPRRRSARTRGATTRSAGTSLPGSTFTSRKPWSSTSRPGRVAGSVS